MSLLTVDPLILGSVSSVREASLKAVQVQKQVNGKCGFSYFNNKAIIRAQSTKIVIT